MTVLLQLEDAHKRYGEQLLLDGAGVALSDDTKYGLIGRNGAGKSTLCRVLIEDEELEAGKVIRSRSLRLGYLRQHDPFQSGESVLEFLLRDSGRPEWRCGEVAWQFGIKDTHLRRPVGDLSGGWQTRLKLAALLLHDPNLLLLDEPTNFLDLRTQLLLEHFLREFRGGCLIVSHDRTFLKATCNHTLELALGQITSFPGDVDAYLVQQRDRSEHDQRVNASVLAKRRQLETFINKNRANANTASQARSKAKQLERLQLTDIEAHEADVRIRVPDVEPRRGPALRCENLAIGYEDREVASKIVVASNITVEIDHGQRVAVVGDNGQGKTTFLRTVTESLEPLGGRLHWGFGCEVGVYAQHVYSSLPEEKTVREHLEYVAAPGTTSQTVLDVAGSFLFSGDQVEKSIKVLSGGERARLCLAGILLGRFNVLVLDEPANHLDVESVDALAGALCDYRGTVVFTSHDRHFMHRVANGVIEVCDGRVAHYPGDYETYLYRVGREIDEGLRDVAHAGRQSDLAELGNRRTSQKAEARRRHDARKQATALERKIARRDQQKNDLAQQLHTTTDPAEAQRIHEQLASIAAEISEFEDRWFALQSDSK